MRKFFSVFIVMIGLFSFAIAEDSSVQENAEKSVIQQGTNEEEESLDSELLLNEMQETRHPAWVGWVFGASEFAIDVYSSSGMSAMSTISGSIGPRFNFTSMSASTIADPGFSIAGRLGFGVSGVNNFHTTGFVLPIELEASYTVGKFTASAGFSFLVIPEIGNIKDITSAGIYADLGFASLIGGLSFRLGYIFHSNGNLTLFNKNVAEIDPLGGSFNFGFHWQI